MATCIAQLLQAYAHGQSFSGEAKGGGPESNMRLLLALVALGRYFVGCSSPEDIQVSLVMLLTLDATASHPWH